MDAQKQHKHEKKEGQIGFGTGILLAFINWDL